MSESIQQIDKAQRDKWAMLGHEPVYARGTVRLASLKKSFPRDLVVTVFDKDAEAYRPLILWDGKPLHAHEILPERADLALDERGRVLSQGEFEQNYALYLDAFVYPPGSDPRLEPVPNVVSFISEEPDKFSESRGMVPIRFNPRLDQEFKPRQRYGPNGETEEEWKREQSRNNGNDLGALVKLLAEALKGNAVNAVPVAEVENSGEEIPTHVDPITPDEAVAALADNDRELAPCGKAVKKGYTAQHIRHCKNEACGEDSVNSHRNEEA